MPEEIQKRFDEIHTTPMGIDRKKRNLKLTCPDSAVVGWCKAKIAASESEFLLKGKNCYITSGSAVFTLNKYHMTLITAKMVIIH